MLHELQLSIGPPPALQTPSTSLGSVTLTTLSLP